MKLHYSPVKGAYTECRATINCPFGGSGEHSDLHEVVQQARKTALAEIKRGVPMAEVTKARIVDGHGVTKPIEFTKDGGYRLGARNYDKSGGLVPADSTVRVRAHRQWKDTDGWQVTGELPEGLKTNLQAVLDQEDEPDQAMLDADDEARQRYQQGKDLKKEHEFFRALFTESMNDEAAEHLSARVMAALDKREADGKSTREKLAVPFLHQSYRHDPTPRGVFGWIFAITQTSPWWRRFFSGYKRSYKAGVRG